MRKSEEVVKDFWNYVKLPEAINIAVDFARTNLLDEKPEETIVKDAWVENIVLTLIIEFFFHQISLQPPRFLYSHLAKFEISKEGKIVNYEFKKWSWVSEMNPPDENTPPEASTPR